MAFNLILESFCQEERMFHGGLGEDQEKFRSAVPKNEIDLTKPTFQQLGEFLQDAVREINPKPLDKLIVIVNCKHDAGERSAISLCSTEFVFELFTEKAPLIDPCATIGDCVLLQSIFQLSQFRVEMRIVYLEGYSTRIIREQIHTPSRDPTHLTTEECHDAKM